MNTAEDHPWQLASRRPNDFAVVVQTIPQRKAALSATLASLADSDVGDLFVVTQQPHQTKQQNLVAALTMLALSDKEWGIRFEDDVLVNRHLLANVASWGALSEPNFGAGWLYHSMGLAKLRTGMSVSDRGNWFRDCPDLVGSLGVVMYVPMIPFIIMGLRRCWDTVDGAQDKSMSRAVWNRALRVYVHEPPLVEHNVQHVSTLAPDRPVNLVIHTTGGMFDPSWRRSLD